MALIAKILSFDSFPDASGAPAVVEVRRGHQAARFALDMLGSDTPSCNGLGSGLSASMTHKAAEVARRLYAARVAELGGGWIEANRAMYAE